MHRAHKRLVRLAKQHGVKLRQPYESVGKYALSEILELILRSILLLKPIIVFLRIAALAMDNRKLPLPGRSPVNGKCVEVRFDGELLSTDGGVLALREVATRRRNRDRRAAPARPAPPGHALHGEIQSDATPPQPSTRHADLSRRATQRGRHNGQGLGVDAFGHESPRAAVSISIAGLRDTAPVVAAPLIAGSVALAIAAGMNSGGSRAEVSCDWAFTRLRQ